MVGTSRTIAAALLALVATEASALTVQDRTVDGLKVLTYGWTDSKGLARTVSLKKQGGGNPGNGGFAVQMTYQYVDGDRTRTVVIAPSLDDEGFGYFVSHERFRQFRDGTYATIARKIFDTSDSPLGKRFPVTMERLAETPARAAVKFTQTYPRHGSKKATTFDEENGVDDPLLAVKPSLYAQYDLGITITWSFEDGRDYPRIGTTVDLSDIPGPDRVAMDVRGPYGTMDFDVGDNPIAKVMWGDRFHFETTAAPVTKGSSWTWNKRNNGARYHALIAGEAEFGLVEPRLYRQSATNDSYAEARGKTSETYNRGRGCRFAEQLIPCDYEWAYQSTQYEFPPENPTGPAFSEKIAWGSVFYYGMSLDSTWDGGVGVPFDGFPRDRLVSYDTCLVYGRTTPAGLAKGVAARGGNYNCAAAPR